MCNLPAPPVMDSNLNFLDVQIDRIRKRSKIRKIIEKYLEFGNIGKSQENQFRNFSMKISEKIWINGGVKKG